VLHLPTNARSALPDILDRAGPLPVAHAIDGQRPQPGHIYVAPSDVHVLLRRHRIQLVRGPTENGHRPAIDPRFRSAAEVYGSRVIDVVRSGVLDDGAHGLLAIARRGGLTVVQSPDDALHPSMPQSAIDTVPVDVVASAEELGAAMTCLLGHTLAPNDDFGDRAMDEVASSSNGNSRSTRPRPKCSGTCWRRPSRWPHSPRSSSRAGSGPTARG
jgi:two-component system chemotaxis response regulator CheB